MPALRGMVPENPPDQLARRLNDDLDPSCAHGRVSYVDTVSFGAWSVRRYRLANGLRIAVQRDRSAPVVSYQTWFHVGSRHETEGKTGLAHLFEHLMFNETATLPHGEFDRLVEAAGGDANAATWVDWTYYQDAVPRRQLPLIVRLEADRMANLQLRAQQVISEKEVVANERRYRVDDDVEGFANEQLWAAAFRKHPYRWPTIGWMRDIEGFTTEDCARFYGTYYAPNNADVVVVGDVREDVLLRLIQENYGHLPPAALPGEAPVREPSPRRELVRTLHGETPTEKLQLGYRIPGFGHPDHATLDVVNDLLFGGRSSRVFRTLIQEREIATEVRGSLSPFRDPGLLEVWVAMRPGRTADDALEVLDNELRRLALDGVAAAELQKAQNRLELAFWTAMETASGRAEQIGFYQTVLGDVAQLERRFEALRRVGPDDVQRVAARYLVPRRRTVIRVMPGAAA